MKIMIKYIIVSVFLLVQMLPLSAFAEERAGEVSISPMVGAYVFDNDQDIEKDVIGALGLGYNFTEHWATEFMASYGRFDHKYFNLNSCRCEEERITGWAMHMDMLYNFCPDKKLVPYVAAGFGGVMLDTGHMKNDDYTAANYGGGVKYFLNENMALRADARHIIDLEYGNNNAAFTVGMTFQFGGEEKVVPPPPPAPEVVPIEALKPAPVKEKITIDLKVQFDLDKAKVKPQYHENIKKLADFMKKYPDTDVELEGHTCKIGTAAYNMDLSIRRADAVKAYLVKHFGIDPARITTKGYGLTKPIADNSTRQGRIKNRRVYAIVSEEVIVEQPATMK
ncbi:MAG: outer membrane beta-barrel domain-containing protein [Desulfobacteraceae bacterium]|nr:MAG: outer membrane beta-barrel domain-containing protein [Desulfobacteraceae bacterium]